MLVLECQKHVTLFCCSSPCSAVACLWGVPNSGCPSGIISTNTSHKDTGISSTAQRKRHGWVYVFLHRPGSANVLLLVHSRWEQYTRPIYVWHGQLRSNSLGTATELQCSKLPFLTYNRIQPRLKKPISEWTIMININDMAMPVPRSVLATRSESTSRNWLFDHGVPPSLILQKKMRLYIWR